MALSARGASGTAIMVGFFAVHRWPWAGLALVWLGIVLGIGAEVRHG